MNLHRLLFPTCSQAALQLSESRITELEAENKQLRAKYDREVTRNRKREDALLDRILTRNQQFGLGSRAIDEVEESPVTEPVTPEPVKAGSDSVREAMINARTLEFEAAYEARGRSVPRPAIRQMVEENFDYVMNDDRVEMD